MPEISQREFKSLLAERSSPEARELVGFLCDAAAAVGASAHPYTTEKGWGVKFKKGDKLVCVLDPKREKGGKGDHVWVMIKDADRRLLKSVGEVSPRTDDVWVKLENNCRRDVVVQEIKNAYERV